MDAIVAFQIYEAMQKQLDEIDARFPNPYFPAWTLRRYFEEIVMPWVNESIEIEIAGVYVNEQQLAENSNALQEKIRILKQEIGIELNMKPEDLGSQEKLGKRLEELKWENLGRTKKGHYQTNDTCLEEWAKTHSEAVLLQRMRTLDTLFKTFIGTPKKEEEQTRSKFVFRVRRDDPMKRKKKKKGKKADGWYQYLYEGKINPVYASMLADTHRNRCSNPNWMNLAVHDKEHAPFVTRNVGLPGPNFKYCSVDYSALQIKLSTIESHDKVLSDIYRNKKSGGDLHSITGYTIFCAGKIYDVEKIVLTLEDGTEKEIFACDEIEVVRDGTPIKIQAKDAQEGDEIP
jgi:DNA polymerase I-like protein with 3'-5' exonuclease and polymerase domains